MNIAKCLTALFAMLVTVVAFANSGSATMGFSEIVFHDGPPADYRSLRIFVSNVTASQNKITVTFYDRDGNVIVDGDDSTATGLLRSGAGAPPIDWNENQNGASVTFKLAKHSTTEIYFRPSTKVEGFVVVEWKQGGPDTVGLVAHAYFESSTEVMDWEQINNGLPF